MIQLKDQSTENVLTLAKEAFDAFCDDLSTMFEVEITCTEKEQGNGSLSAIKKHFKKLTAVHRVKAEGAIDGEFPLVFDQGGLFVLAGVIVMLPEARIKEEAKRGSEQDAEAMSDAVGEVGNLLVGTWDRIFREDFQGHKHFTKAGTFVGKAWDDPEAAFGAAEDQPCEFALYEMTVENFPSFLCAVVLSVGQAAAETEESQPTEQEQAATAQEEPEKIPADSSEPDEPDGEAVGQPAEESATVAEEPAEPQSPAEGPQEEPVSEPEATAPGDPAANSAAEEVEDPQATVADGHDAEKEPADEPVSDREVTPQAESPTIDEEASATAESPSQSRAESVATAPQTAARMPTANPAFNVGPVDGLDLTADQVMDTEVVWAQPDESVQDVLERMQQHDTGYVLVGRDGRLEGLVSKSNVMGALSPYLRPVFAKWRRPADDATLNIKVQWIMSRPVRTVRPETPVATMMQLICQFGGRCLPVVDPNGTVVGIVTVFDLLKAVTAGGSSAWVGRTPQAPCLMV